MQNLGRWEPKLSKASHALPVQAMALATASQRLEPVPCHLDPEGLHRPAVAWHRVVGEMSSHHACQPPALLRDGQMTAALESVVNLGKLGPHPFSDRDAPEPELPAPAFPADRSPGTRTFPASRPRALPDCWRRTAQTRSAASCRDAAPARTSRTAHGDRAGTAWRHLDAGTRQPRRRRSAR